MHAWLAGYPSYSLHRPQSFFEHVEYLAGGSLLTLDLSVMRTSVQKYWQAYSSYSMYADASITPQTSSDYLTNYRAALIASVKEECLADLSIGLFLSGGVDAAVLAGLAAKISRITAFTISATSFEKKVSWHMPEK